MFRGENAAKGIDDPVCTAAQLLLLGCDSVIQRHTASYSVIQRHTSHQFVGCTSAHSSPQFLHGSSALAPFAWISHRVQAQAECWGWPPWSQIWESLWNLLQTLRRHWGISCRWEDSSGLHFLGRSHHNADQSGDLCLLCICRFGTSSWAQTLSRTCGTRPSARAQTLSPSPTEIEQNASRRSSVDRWSCLRTWSSTSQRLRSPPARSPWLRPGTPPKTGCSSTTTHSLPVLPRR